MSLKLVLVLLAVPKLGKVFAQYDEIVPTTKTYDLQVPGSDPIRIIEAEPLWGRNPQDSIVTTSESSWSDLEHRALKPRIKATPFHTKPSFSSPNVQSDENETENIAPDSTEDLTKFLKGYAEHIRRTTKSPPVADDYDYDSAEKFHKVELITKASDEPTSRLASIFLQDDDDKDASDIVEDKSKGWNLMNMKKHKHPFDDKNGWVSLEVVPWSVSKVAKWHSSMVKPNSDEKPWQNKHPDYGNSATISKPAWNFQPNKPLVASYNPPSPVIHHTNPFNYGSANIESKPDPRPVFSVPSTTFAQKVYLQQQEYSDEIPRPPWSNKKPQNIYYDHHQSQQEDMWSNKKPDDTWSNNKPQNIYYDLHENQQEDIWSNKKPPAMFYGHQQDHKDENCEHGPPGIITDGLPPNFPKQYYESNRRKGSSGDNEHPATHPFNGDGEWVLLTTTKGYKSPSARAGQRSLDIEATPYNDPESISTHKSVRLTVLPPLKDSKINMTTSHGGLLQVESTFETVDEAQKTALKKENMKRKPLRRRPMNKPIKQTMGAVVPTSNTIVGTVTPTTKSKKKMSHASSVLAAVGAGMIPATMAMLVPMAMGRRRRRDLLYTTRSPDILELEIQLPHTL